ncbi:MAG: hypothetical protein ABSC11_01220 [Smithella sp.]
MVVDSTYLLSYEKLTQCGAVGIIKGGMLPADRHVETDLYPAGYFAKVVVITC